MAAAVASTPPEAIAMHALSEKLTSTIAHVELQRSTIEEVIMRLAEQATQLSAVSDVLTEATYAQGGVLQELSRLLQTSNAPAPLGDALKPAAEGLANAASMLQEPGSKAAAAVPPQHVGASGPPSERSEPETAGSAATFDSFANFDTVSTAVPAPTPTAEAQASRVPPPTQATNAASFGPKPPARKVIEPDLDDFGGVEYVKGLEIQGAPITGEALEATAEFVGTPSVQWYRAGGDKGVASTAIPGMDTLTYVATADDAGCILRVECIGPYGGDAIVAEVCPQAMHVWVARGVSRTGWRVTDV